MWAELKESLHCSFLKICKSLARNCYTIIREGSEKSKDFETTSVGFSVVESSTEALVSCGRIIELTLCFISKLNCEFHSPQARISISRHLLFNLIKVSYRIIGLSS